MTDGLFRVYFDPAEIGPDGYPHAWHGKYGRLSEAMDRAVEAGLTTREKVEAVEGPRVAIKDLVREQAGHRCVRCGHPYRKGEHGNGEWSPCDEFCTHRGPIRFAHGLNPDEAPVPVWELLQIEPGIPIDAQWRILTVHHLNGVKHDCRWWNLVALDQRCHLTIQGKVFMDRPWVRQHKDWFKPYAAGFYAWKYLGLELTREETMARLDELLDLEFRQEALW